MMKKISFLILSLFVAVLAVSIFLAKNATVESSSQHRENLVSETLPDSGERLFGLTIDESSILKAKLLPTVINQLKIIRNSQPETKPPTVRLVLPALCLTKNSNGTCISFDTAKLDNYVSVVNNLKKDELADVMIEIMDSSSNISQNCFVERNISKSVNCYESLTKFLYEYKDLGKNVAFWEIGNEINMPEYGAAGTPPALRRQIIVNQVKAANDWLQAKNAKTAVTYYFNGYGENRKNYEDENDSMLSWLKNDGAHFKTPQGEKINFSNVDFVLISYYPDDNFYDLNQTVPSACYPREKLKELPIDLSVADWVELITEFNKHYDSKTKFGLGEMGTHCFFKKCDDKNCSERRNGSEEGISKCPRDDGYCPRAQTDIIRQDYDQLDKEIRKNLQDNSLRNRFIGGYFYWFYSPDVINKIESRHALKKNNAVKTRSAILDVYQRWNAPIQAAENLNLIKEADDTKPALQIKVLQPGSGKTDPYTIVIVNNPVMAAEGGFKRDPINDNQEKFDQSVNYIYANLFGKAPNQAEKVLSDESISDKIRVISIWINEPSVKGGETDCFVELDGQFEARQTAINDFFTKLNKDDPGININPDIVFAVTGWEHKYKATAFAAREKDCQKGVKFWYDKTDYRHCFTSEQPGVIAINAEDDSMTALHEFSHAASSYDNGYVDDLNNKELNCDCRLTINKKRKSLFDRRKEFAVYYLDGADPNDPENHYSVDKSETRTEKGIFAPFKIDPEFPALMDDYHEAKNGNSEKCQHDKLTRQFLLDRIRAKTMR